VAIPCIFPVQQGNPAGAFGGRFSPWMAAGHMWDVTYRYVAGLSRLSGVPIEQLGRQRNSDSD
jgi:hypothetical protein